MIKPEADAHSFRVHCLHWLANGKSELYLEYMSGGDSFYGGKPPVSPDVWKSMPNEKKALLVEQTLNQKSLSIRYPGTFNGPSAEDLWLLAGLSAVQHLHIDSMQVKTYRALLDIPHLKSVQLDTFAHAEGYMENLWCVFDALLYTRSKDFRCELGDISRYRHELSLQKAFGQNHARMITSDGRNNPDLSFISEEYLYKHFSI